MTWVHRSNPAILVDTIHAVNWAWIWADSPPEGVQRPDGLRAMLRVRHRMTAVPCTVKSYVLHRPYIFVCSMSHLLVICFLTSDELMQGISGASDD